MCGIVGVISNHESLNIINDVQTMMDVIKHRGPDDNGKVIFNQKVALGHVRLSILDLSSNGHQPMYSKNGKYCIVYNGEIYNYKELKDYIKKHYSFDNWSSNCDTEVIVEGFALEGRRFIEKMNGIFALAICDIEENEVFIARDGAGVKPLYVCEQNECVYFASELKALTKIGLSLNLRLQSVKEQLVFMYVPEPYTLFNEIKKVQIGEYRVYKGNKLVESAFLDKSYFHRDYSFDSEEEALDILDDLTNHAVKKQLISDVPVSLFLSGGLDSSLITALSKKNGANIKDAYTIEISKDDLRNEGEQKNDLYYARIIAKQLGFELNVIEAKQDMLSYLPQVVYHLDDALSDPAAINAYLICKNARKEGVKVMLSGQGADEVFGGYRRYRAMRFYQSFPKPLASSLKPLIDSLPNNTQGRINSIIRRSKKFIDNAVRSDEEQMVGLAMWIDPCVIDSLFVEGDSLKNVGGVHYAKLSDYKDMIPIKRLMRMDEEVYLTSHNLMYTDRMSMMAGVEARVPFLDFNLVDFAHQLPVDFLVTKKQQKYLLKKLGERYLPNEVIYRSKAGFGSPIRSWFRNRNELTDRYFSEEFILRQGIFNPKVVDSLYKQQLDGKADYAYFLYALLSFQIWYEIYIEGVYSY